MSYPTTPNLGLPLVPDADQAWGPAMRGAMVTLDTTVPAIGTAANAAITNAATAQAAATAAQTGVDTINEPDTLSLNEKPQVIQDYSALTGENADLVAKATALSVSHSAYDAAYTALVTTYLPTLTSPAAWNSLAGVTSLGAGNRLALWNPKWLALRSAAADLKAAIASGAFVQANSADATAAIANSTAVTAAQNAPLNVTGLPALPNATYPANKLVYDNTTKRLYRSTGSAWEAATADAGDLTGTLNAARVAVGSLDAKITTITNAQLGTGIDITKLTGTLDAARVAVGSLDAKISAISNAQLGTGIDITKLTGTLDAARVAVGSLDAKISAVDAAKLTTGTLDVARIAANTIDQSKIASLPTSKLTGTVGADLIAANAILANNLTVANFDNLIPNPTSSMNSFPSGYTGPDNAGLVGLSVSALAPYGYGRRTVCSGSAGTAQQQVSVSGIIPCAPGDEFFAQCQCAYGNAFSGNIRMCMEFYNAGSYVAGSAVASATGVSGAAAAPSTISVSGVVPAGANGVLFYFQQDSANPGDFSNFNNFYARRKADANLIVDGAITTAKMTANSISGDRISAGTLDASKIVADSITAGQIAAGAITSNELAANSVIAGKILAGAIVAADIAASTITGANIAASTITGGNIAADTITAGQIAANAITSNELAANSVIAGKILAGTIVAADIAASTITGANIAASTITGGNIAADTITAGQIAAGAIGAGEVAAGSIFARHLIISNFDNLIPNPNTDATISAAAVASGAIEGSGALLTGIYVLAPTGYMRRTVAVGSAGSASNQLTITPDIQCNAGDQFFAQCQCAYGTAFRGNIRIAFGFWGASGYISGSAVYSATGMSGAYNSPSTISIQGTAPAGATRMSIWVQTDAANPGDVNYFNNFYARRMNDSNVIVDGAITANKLETDLATANIIRSANWDGSSSIQSSMGYKVSGTGFVAKAADSSTATVQADFAAATMMGGYLVGGLTARAMSAIGDNGATGTSFRCWYRGNNDATNSGAPTIASSDANPASTPRLLINSTKVANPAAPGMTYLTFQVQPQSVSDNLDGLRYVEVEVWYRSSTSMIKTLDYFPIAMESRRWRVPGTDTDSGNAAKAGWIYSDPSTLVVGLSGATNYLILKCRIVNAVGESTEHYFTPPSAVGTGSTSATGLWTDVGTAVPLTGGSSGGSGGGGGGGGTCPAPDVPLLMADGTEKPAGDIRVGDLVVAWDEEAGVEVVERVTHAELVENERWWLALSNGRRGRFARNHRFLLDSGDWCELQHLTTGESLSTGVQVVGIEPEQTGPVIKITVNRVHTYITLGVVSHNVKIRS